MDGLLDAIFRNEENDSLNNLKTNDVALDKPPQVSEKMISNVCINLNGQIEPPKLTLPENIKSFNCHWQGCNAILSTRTGLATHASDHLKIHFKSDSAKKQKLQVVCRWNGCNKWFDNIILLAKHLADESHIGQTPYIPKEPIMNQPVSDEEMLKQKKRYPCDKCSKTFSSSSNLRVHEKLHDPDRKRHTCDLSPSCKRSYSTEADLKIHMRSHRGEFAYKCSFPSCTEVFVRASQLYAHERVHDNIAILKCGLCGKRFRMKAELVQHEQIHLVTDAKILLESFSNQSLCDNDPKKNRKQESQQNQIINPNVIIISKITDGLRNNINLENKFNHNGASLKQLKLPSISATLKLPEQNNSTKLPPLLKNNLSSLYCKENLDENMTALKPRNLFGRSFGVPS